MRVVLVTGTYLDIRVGGVESYVYQLARHLKKLGHEATVLRTGRGVPTFPAPGDVDLKVLRGSRATSPRWLHTTTSREALRRILDGVAAARAVRWVLGQSPTVVHFNDLTESLPLAAAIHLRSPKTPLIWTNHLGEFLTLARTSLGRAVLRGLTFPYSEGIGPSQELTLQTACHPNMRFVPNGFDPSTCHPATPAAKRALRRAYGISESDYVVLVPRRWAPNKGIHVLAEALTLALRPVRPMTVLFAGNGEDRYGDYQRHVLARLKSSIVPYRLMGSVPAEQMPALYQLSDLTVVPSYKEATSLSACESLGCGVPVVATNVGGLRDIHNIMGGAGIRLVQPGSVQDLHGAIEAAAVDELRAEEQERIASRARDQLSWRAVTEKVVMAYRAALT